MVIKDKVVIATPSKEEIKKYLSKWDNNERYTKEESSINLLFTNFFANQKIENILLKVSTINTFHSTNVYSIFPVAQRILELDIDQRLAAGDLSVVDQIKKVVINGKERNLYSFATKYCAHHNPLKYPIYDNYVDRMLNYFRQKDQFSDFRALDLKDYKLFTQILNDFIRYYNLADYSLKEIDRYLWQLGKEYFPNNYGGNKDE